MPSPGSCSRCNRALAADSDGGLCQACRRAAVVEATGLPPRRSRPVRLPANIYNEPTRTQGDGSDPGHFSPDPDHFLPEAPPGYDLLERLGAGGMGTVYLAREHAAERTVAMKLLNAPSSRTAIERFLVEARALARLDHPNIIKIIAVELNWREPFLTMEYADAGSLADLTEPSRLPPPTEAARLVLAAADAVAAAHTAGILHRDLKPSNILLQRSEVRGQRSEVRGQKSEGPTDLGSLTSDLCPKVSDFGLAKRTDRDDGLTRTGPIGTPRYMSPEAAAGRFQAVGSPADVYGLGATLYHLLTGQPPFIGDGPDEVIRKVINDPLNRPRAVRPDLPAELEAVVVKAMEKDPAKRYPTAADLAADLRRFLSGEAPAAPVQSPRRRATRWLGRHRVRIATAIGVLVLAGTLVAAGRILWPPRSADPEQRIRDELADGEVVPLLTAEGRPRVASWPLGQEGMEEAGDGTFAFGSSGPPRVLILLNDPGVDSYRLSADLWQVRKVGTGAELSASEVGLVLGYAEQPGAGAARVHTLMAFRFSDFDPDDDPDVRRVLELVDIGLVSPDWLAAKNVPTARGAPPAPLPRTGPGWRTVSVVVTPEGVWAPGRTGRPELADADGIARRRTGLQDQLADTAGPITLPAWSPRMPVGIWCRGSWVAVKNVTVERIP